MHVEKKDWPLRKFEKGNITESLRKYNSTTHQRGETLPEDQQVYCVKVVSAFLKAGIPLGAL